MYVYIYIYTEHCVDDSCNEFHSTLHNVWIDDSCSDIHWSQSHYPQIFSRTAPVSVNVGGDWLLMLIDSAALCSPTGGWLLFDEVLELAAALLSHEWNLPLRCHLSLLFWLCGFRKHWEDFHIPDEGSRLAQYVLHGILLFRAI